MLAPLTNPTLLGRLLDKENQTAWTEFVDLYSPVVYGFARAKGLDSQDSADIVQETMLAVSRAFSRYEYRPGDATFRAWFYTIARNKITSHFRRCGRRIQGDGNTTALEMAEANSAEDESTALWNREYYRALFDWAAEQIRPQMNPRIWDAFHRTAILEQSPEDVADVLGMTRAAVNVAKCRCIHRLGQKILSMAGDQWEILVRESSLDTKSG